MSTFFPRTASLWISLPAECFPLTYDLNGFRCTVNRLLSALHRVNPNKKRKKKLIIGVFKFNFYQKHNPSHELSLYNSETL